jgi:hypothetical protein
MGDMANLTKLELNDNFISELGQVKHLGNLRKLHDLVFRYTGQEFKGKNPICDLQNYTVTVKMYCMYLRSFDGLSVHSEHPTKPVES